MKITKRTVRFWPLADIPYDAFDVAFGVKRTSACALHMSAFDPKRTPSHRLKRQNRETDLERTCAV